MPSSILSPPADDSIPIHRLGLTLRADPSRVLVRPFNPSTEERAQTICTRVLSLPESEVRSLLQQIEAEFGGRHREMREFFKRRFEHAQQFFTSEQKLSEERRLLVGAHFTHEYSLEAAALFNPSIVPHPDQSDLPDGMLRFVLSLRATGEGHISSVTFRTGFLDRDGQITINEPTRYCLEPAQAPNAFYEKPLFVLKLHELGLSGEFTTQALQNLGDTFSLHELDASITRTANEFRSRGQGFQAEARKTLALAQSNYDVHFAPDSRLSERVLFPATPSQSNGIEDARFVQFQEEDGSQTYYATYTAYDGKLILPQFIETPDFVNFKFVTLNGTAVQNKGMALFPRKIKGRYAMLGRQDYENIYVMFSDQLHFWNDTCPVVEPKYPWEFIQMGNCGSPIETEAGWLVLTHGVGAMRKYCIGAVLLDLDDPTKIVGRLREPLIKPNENEREGLVPNVVYSCGSLLHGRQLILPYAMSDSATTFATLSLDDLLAAITKDS